MKHKAFKTLIAALLIIAGIGIASHRIAQLERRIEAQEVVIAGYQDVFQSWDEIRRSQLVLLELLERRN